METIVARFRETYHIRQLGDLARRKPRHKRWLQTAAAIVGPLAIIIGAAAWEGSFRAAAMVLGLVLVLGVMAMFLLLFLLLPFIAKLEFDASPEADDEVQWSFSDDSISLTNHQGTLSGLWSDFHPFEITEYGFLLSSNSGPVYLIPYDALEDFGKVDDLKAMACRNGALNQEPGFDQPFPVVP